MNSIQDNVYMWASRYGVSGEALRELLVAVNPGIPDRLDTSDRTTEAGVQSELRLAAPTQGAALWRNNNGAFEDPKTGRHVRFGLGNDSPKLNKDWKSADLIGITPVVATRVGQIFGVFTAVEVKTPGWKAPKTQRDRAQANFLNTVQSLGGIGMFAQSRDDYLRMFV